jgi:hypothetical protein
MEKILMIECVGGAYCGCVYDFESEFFPISFKVLNDKIRTVDYYEPFQKISSQHYLYKHISREKVEKKW